MDEERINGSPVWSDPRGQEMKTPDDVAEMLRLKACGWGIKRIGRALGCSHHTVRHYVFVGGVAPFKAPKRRKLLDGHEGWLRERFIRHRGNADVLRQDLLAEKCLKVSRRTLQRAVQPHRQALRAEALATTRFETPLGRQLQIGFGERFVEIGGDRIKAFVFVATLGHSRRVHVRAFRNEKQEHRFGGLESTFRTFGGVPEEVLMDNPRALGVRHDAVSRTVQFNDKLIAFARHWGFALRACAPYRARTKGKTENGVGYVKKNAIAGHGFAISVTTAPGEKAAARTASRSSLLQRRGLSASFRSITSVMTGSLLRPCLRPQAISFPAKLIRHKAGLPGGILWCERRRAISAG